MTNPGLKSIFEAFRKGATALTANSRLSRHLRASYDRHMCAQGLLSWPTPEALPLSSWASSFWQEHGDEPVLGPTPSSVLWERIIDAHGAGRKWPGGVAKASYEAYCLMKEYGIRLPEDIYLTEESKALKAWISSYSGELRQFGCIDSTDVMHRVKSLISKGAPVPKEAVLAGFDETSPAVSPVIAALKARGTNVWFWPGEEARPSAKEVNVLAFADEHEETAQAARWARTAIEPNMTIGFIAPQLEAYREIILREFSAELNPASVLPGAESDEVFNISLGTPLSEEPLAAIALELLLTGEGEEEAGRLFTLLRSPYFSTNDNTAIARVDLRLRKENRIAISLWEMKRLLRGHAVEKRLDAWTGWLRDSGKKELPSAWASSFTKLLKDAGWLAQMDLSSREFQAHKAWNGCLERLSTLDGVLGRIKRAEAAALLSRIVRESIHQPETPDCNVQVLGLLESTGISFDRLWILGCHEHALPMEPAPNPFIPIWLQKEKMLPRSSSERELLFGRRAAARLLQSSPVVNVSYPLFSEQRERRVSPFFSSFPKVEMNFKASAKLADSVRAAAKTEDALPDAPIPVAETEKALIRGGTSILKNQSMCPFRAFAIHRLNAVAVPETELGIRPVERGSLVHAALRLFWEKVESSERLREMKEGGQLDGFIESLAEKALDEAKLSPALRARFRALEKKRLVSVIAGWMSVELSRGARFHVKALEAEKEIEIGGLKIRGRVDRIDELEDGGEVIIDYKIGAPNRYDWLTERPREPQLLIYSSTGGFEAISFARIAPDESGFVGISRNEVLPGVKPYDADGAFRKKAEERDWEALMAFWRETLSALAEDFLKGSAKADPNNGTGGSGSACIYCELTALCRITETGLDLDTGGIDEDRD